jgi:hypothetical protein
MQDLVTPCLELALALGNEATVCRGGVLSVLGKRGQYPIGFQPIGDG